LIELLRLEADVGVHISDHQIRVCIKVQHCDPSLWQQLLAQGKVPMRQCFAVVFDYVARQLIVMLHPSKV
jgi:hypothetical protein